MIDPAKLKLWREKLDAMPKPWNFLYGKKPNAVEKDIRIDVYAGEKADVEAMLKVPVAKRPKQLFHYHGVNGSRAARKIEWMSKNEQALQVIEFICEMRNEILDELLTELEGITNGNANN